MVVLSNFNLPEEGIRHKQENTRAHVCQREVGEGTLYITESRVSWVTPNGQGFSLEYPSICLHAVSRDLTAFPHQCLYLMVDANLNEEENNSPDSDDDENESKVSDVRFIPADSNALDTMFSAMSECQTLHPDPEEDPLTDDEDDEAWEGVAVEEGGGDNLITTEEGLQNLTPEGRATLQHLESVLRVPGAGDSTEENSVTPNGANEEEMDTGQFEDADDNNM